MQLVSKRESRWLTIRDMYTQRESQNGGSNTHPGQVLYYLVQMLPAWRLPGFLLQTGHFHTPILILRAVHSGNLNWTAVEGHGGEKWRWVQQSRVWLQHCPGQLIASQSITGSGQKAGPVDKPFLVCLGPIGEWSFPLWSDSCFRKQCDQKATRRML